MVNFDPDAAALENAGIYGLPHSSDEAAVVLLPVPWEVTTSYRPGTARGPAAIRAASGQIDLFDVETGSPYQAGIAMLDEADEVHEWNAEARALAEPVIAMGGRTGGDVELERALARVNSLGADLNRWVHQQTRQLLDRGKLVGIVGGDHSCPFGAIEAIAAHHPGVGILHIDAHADLRRAYEGFTWSHASIMFNVVDRLPRVERIVQVGIRDICGAEHELIAASNGRVIAHYDAELSRAKHEGRPWADACAEIVSSLPDEVYISFDIDGLDPALCPNTGTPVPGGMSFAEINTLLRTLTESQRRVVGFDLCEVAPGEDDDEWDANVGMRVLYKLIGWSLASRSP